MIIEIEALDTLFFRDGKPFEKSDDVWATGMFPPLPSVIYGALRSAYLGQNDVDLDDIKAITSGLKIKNIWYKIKGKNENNLNELVYFPMPLDLVKQKTVSRLEKVQIEDYNLYSSHQLTGQTLDTPSSLQGLGNEKVLMIDADVETIRDGFVTDTNFENYLKGHSLTEVYQFAPESEAKIGIARNNATRTTSEGNLYRVGMLRANNIKILIEFDGLVLEKKGLLPMGGERKLVSYKSPRSTWIPEISSEDMKNDSKQFKLCLTTPAIFDNGYYPTKIFETAGVKVKLTSCAVGKCISVGGFDVIEKKPKEMFRAVPAGSVYYYELESGDLTNLIKVIKANNICEKKAHEGFGVAFIGKV